jgi:hypothetical protein
MTRNFTRFLLLLLVNVMIGACAGGPPTPLDPPPGPDPLNAAYIIEDQIVPLVNGRSRVQAVPGSASLIRADVFGDPLYGDLDGDGDEDAAVVIVYDPGGSGTFYYIAAAIHQNGQYKGTAGYRLGDRIILQTLAYDNGVLLVRYLDRRPGEPMSAPPSARTAVQLRMAGDKLAPLSSGTAEEQVLRGWVTFGHEVQSFLPCAGMTEHWLLGISPALRQIAAAYRKALPRARAYDPLFMALAGHSAPAPSEGFGADYSAAFYATRLVQVWPGGNCRQDFIVVTSPQAGDFIRSPLLVRGQARGTWFFEGDFPLILKDHQGRVIARGFATAQGPWMTKEFVPFEGTLKFKVPAAAANRGTLVFQKDNPTDRPELDDAMELPVYLK